MPTDAWCTHCGKVGPTKDVRRVPMKNGRMREAGACAGCGTKTSKIVKGSA